MEKDKEIFEKLRREKIDSLIEKLNDLKEYKHMFAFRNDIELYKKDIDDIFTLFEDKEKYIVYKRLIKSMTL